ncbi:isochorismatase family protein [Sphingobium sp.]|jgi:nicotinamidase-related amidase|uniref:isochorismatase family protein n=1 Tax=Sphingobium sp. TaxID=1912891 RepID=UPI000C11302B|nr:isochorismatase family protein [Sphingobium sp.]PHQ63944.1 MAG: carbamoylsarcosine amidase [Sphingobium sp.]
MSQDEVYDKAGFGRSAPRGTRPAVIVVDFSYGFTDTSYPTAADMTAEMAATRRLTDAAREQGFPVIYTTIAYQPWEAEALPWLRKATGMKALLAGTRLVEIDSATGISAGDPIIVKHGASAFHGTNLAGLLTAAGVDTVVVTGATTSGCVRATAVDAVQAGFIVLVPRDCCADRAAAPHEANLYDIAQKYGDITSADDILNWFDQIRSPDWRRPVYEGEGDQ